jgi:phospholipase/lecithinase/hemolysin
VIRNLNSISQKTVLYTLGKHRPKEETVLKFSRKHFLVIGLAALFLCAMASGAWAKTYTQILVFGDSLSDDGTNVHKFANDKVWVQYLAEKMGVLQNDVINKAASGATTQAFKTAIQNYKDSIDGDRTLVALWIGGNDIRAGLEKIAAYQKTLMTEAANPQSELFLAGYQKALARSQAEGIQLDQALIQEEIGKLIKEKIQTYAGETIVRGDLLDNIKTNILPSIRTLTEKGATDFLVLNVPNVGSTPGVVMKGEDTIALATAVTAGFNDLYFSALKQTFQAMGSKYSLQYYNVYGFLDSIINAEKNKAAEDRSFKLPPDFYFAAELAALKTAAGTPGSTVFNTGYANTVPIAIAQGIAVDPNPLVNMNNPQFKAIFEVEVEKVVLAELNKIVMAGQLVDGRNPDSYIFWDLLHPTSKAHSMLAADIQEARTSDARNYPKPAKVESEIAGGPCFIDSAASQQDAFVLFLGLMIGLVSLMVVYRRNQTKN